jgi:PAS domain S-box-containing protein
MEDESMFRLLFERSADAITLQDPVTGKFLDVNAASVRITGAPSKAALLGSNPLLISPERQPDGELSSEKVQEVIRRTMEEGSHRFEWMINRFDGTQLPVEIVLTLIRGGDRPLLLSVSRDITEQKKATEEIRQLNAQLEQRIAERTAELSASEARLHTLVEHAPEAIVVFDGATGRFLSGNLHACRLYGRAAEELTQLTPLDVSPEFQPDGRRSEAAARANIQEALAGKTPVFEWMHRHSSGRLISTEVRLVRLPAEGRDLIRASIIDNTARKQAEQALHESAEKFRALFEASSQGVMLHDEQQFLEVNPAAVQILGCSSQADLIGKHPSNVAPPFQPNGEPSDTLARRHIADCLNHGSTRFEWTARHQSGRDIPLDVVLTRIEWGGRQIIQAYITDISRRKAAEEALRQSEEKFKQLYELSPLGMAQVNWDGSFVQVNSAFANLIGYTREEIAKLTYWDVTPPEYEEAELAVLAQLRAVGRFGPHEKEYFHRDGHRVPVVLYGMLVETPDGIGQLWGIVENITERKRAEAELLRALAQEKELSQLKSNFVSMVSHEFRTPLGVIMSSAEILDHYLEQLEPAERREQLQSIQKNSRRMAELMEEVLLLGLVEAGRLDFKPTPLDFPAFCRRRLDELLAATGGKCPVHFAVTGEMANAFADERLLHHVLANLLANAVKYSPAGTPVHLEIERAGDQAICRVRDHGIGIPAADLAQLFQAFHRGGNAGHLPGTGLGLTIVKRCVELHRGQIKIESSVGRGTTVTVTLPLFAPAATPNAVKGTEREEDPGY